MKDLLPPVVVNAQAGGMKNSTRNPEAWLDELANHARVLIVTPDEVKDAVLMLLNDGAERIAVGGGDGTIASAADTLLDNKPETELVCLPLGTHNHFAKDLNVPLDPASWVEYLRSDFVRAVDLGEVNGKLFLNNVSVGLYPALVRRRQHLPDERVLTSKRLATLAAVLSIWRALPRRFSVTYRSNDGGGQVKLRTRLLLISNNQYADQPLAPLARSTLKGGYLTLYAPGTLTFYGAVRMAWHALYGTIEECPDLRVEQGAGFVLELAEKQKTVAVDGELVTAESRLHIRLRPKALQVVVPRKI